MSQQQIQEEENPQINTVNLNDFILQGKIGSGSYGKVFRVKSKHDDIIYAAKISINEIDDTSTNQFIDIYREVNIISKLNHPSVLKFILYSPLNFKRKPKPVIITEYASNGSLSQLIEHDRNNPNDPKLDDTHKLIIIYGIVSAMSYLHSNNILHRDLKPDNILLDDFLIPKVADFGLSKKEQSNQESFYIKTSLGNIKGTPIFMSPEIWTNGEYSKSSDVYAFAFIVFEIMTFEKPYSNINVFSLALKVKNSIRPEFKVYVPEAYKNLIIRCWSQEPSNRPMFDQILIELKTNPEYITEKVNENEFRKYVKFIDE